MTATVVHARLAATVSILALTMATPALAQTAPESAATIVEDIIVTAQKREESIQDVPIAVSAFSAETLDAMKIEGGSELMRAIPNVSFSKNNFSMYNFSIRGIGTKAISASSDPAVAVSFNNGPLIRNRLFEQEYLDVNRVEVLRGPQGTLYGRNATAGVVNMIPNLPGPGFEGMAKAEVGNFGSLRGQGMINMPITETFWVRAAGSFTKRDGFDYNSFNDTQINDRELWSTRLSAAWEPNDNFSVNLIWEHFEEDDQRSRTGKQLCAGDPGPTYVGKALVPEGLYRGRLSQGCLARSLYDDASYSAPNGAALSVLYPAGNVGVGYRDVFEEVILAVNQSFLLSNPYGNVVQSRDMRKVETYFDPKFNAKNDVIQLNIDTNVSDNIKLYSQTLYTRDNYKSYQDYTRYVSNPIFSTEEFTGLTDMVGNPLPDFKGVVGGIYTDPQLGPSNRIVSLDLSQSANDQFFQEFRIQTDFSSRFNFILGANYLNFNTKDDYYVFNNMFTFTSEYFYNAIGLAAEGVVDCGPDTFKECVYVDQTPLSNLAGDGHNYFRSKNEVNTVSWAVFGEGYWELRPDLRFTLGLRYTDDEKTTTPYPSQLLLGANPDGTGGLTTGGFYQRGYPALPKIKQSWDAVTGRAVIDWKPTGGVLLYASYSRGYKGGGANPPRADINPEVIQYQPLSEIFEPEYLDAFELGSKLILLDGRLRFNSTAFYYNYTDYQVSQIVDRISLNENFDAVSYGAEFELAYNVTKNFRVDANIGLLKTRVADGEGSIDVMNRTQGNADWTLVRPWLQVPSNCIAPTDKVEAVLSSPMFEYMGMLGLAALCSGSIRYGSFTPEQIGALPMWTFFGFNYNPLLDAPNGGRGFEADLSGNELPNAPRITANFGAEYVFDIGDWSLSLRADYYRQSSSYFRVYNTEYDKLKGWGNANVSLSFENGAKDIAVKAYIKNVFDDSPIVDAFTNSDDSLLTTNVFTLDPRVFGFSLTKRF